MRTFKVGQRMQIVCESMSRRGGFKHTAVLLYRGYKTKHTAKALYVNRTWERYIYESVMAGLIDNIIEDNSLDKKDINALKRFLKNNRM